MTQQQKSVGKLNTKVRVWDVPIRLFHWIFASCFFIAWLTLDNRYLDIHVFTGYLFGGMILFRILWGFIGGPYACFQDFSFNWSEVKNYLIDTLNNRSAHFPGHNPAGSWAIYLLLGLGLLITISGLLVFGGEEQHGPLKGLLNYAQGDLAHKFHEWLAWLMLGMVIIHLIGVLVESILHRENLLAAMLTGFKLSHNGEISTPLHGKVGTIMFILIIAAGLFWFQGHLNNKTEQAYQPFKGPVLADNTLWREECGSCHLAFHPSLLPERSWKLLMQQQALHFNENLYLEADTAKEIESFLTKNAAEQGLTEPAWKINRSIPTTETPLRITKTTYWLNKHNTISDMIWKHPKVKSKANCAACHMDAELGTYEDASMHLPDNGNHL